METPSDIIPVQPPEAALQKLHAIAGEHFDQFLIVVMAKNGNTWRSYSNKLSAYGMASMICQEVNQDWWNNKNK